ncbi:dTDP-4-dehydrorhamnose reductase [Alkalimonas collagenimarina]|uniref:dTDP-4-dehydrorhamnose reductase n=1 Tax=Alkalimonas collagenimarina TaxID=400390 RepID=A0ABT9H1D9_9GAMM|nr:dTDP-4-dehydrorhamnose reductase [Alkalimonas collagenimarina]MDP4536889.1 dTDP-4-dehydrorhamnose reductase [Alkalimonas collagenimarina]
MSGKVLVTGSTGQVGTELIRQLEENFSVLSPTRTELDLSDANAVQVYLSKHQPAVIFNAAAYTAVDLAETESLETMALNAHLPALLARHSAEHDVYLLHYSTDYVYPGTGTEPWQEDSSTAPLNVYGHSKLQGDKAVLKECPEAVIFRTSWVYSTHGKNFLNTIRRLAKEKTELRIVVDQIGAPTPANMIAAISLLALQRYQQGQAIKGGVYHLAPRGHCSWYDFAKAIVSQAIKQGDKLALLPEAISPIPSSDYPTPAQRPMNSRLCIDKLENALGIELPDWLEALAGSASGN